MTEKHNVGETHDTIFRQAEQFFNFKAMPYGAWFKEFEVRRISEQDMGAMVITLTASSYDVTETEVTEHEDVEFKDVIADEDWDDLAKVHWHVSRGVLALLRGVGAEPEYEDLPVTRAELEHHLSGPHHNSGQEKAEEDTE